MMSYNMQAISGYAPTLTKPSYQLRTGAVHGIGPLTAFVAFVFNPNGVIIGIDEHAIGCFFDQGPGRVVNTAGMPGGIGFLDILVYLAAFSNTIMGRYL